MQFTYEAMSTGGQPKSGVLAAGSVSEVRRLLREQGLFLVKADVLTAGSIRTSSKKSMFTKISKNDILNMTSQFAIMAQAGVDIASSLEMLSIECANPHLREALKSVHNRVAAGESIAEAMQTQKRVFSEAYVASVAAGEASGKLAVVLARLSQLIRADIKIMSTLKSLLAYPIVLVIVSFSVLIALVFFVLPTFSEVFDNMGIPLPGLTRFLLDASEFLMGHLWLVGLVVAGIVGGAMFLLRHPKGRRYLDQAILRIPVISVITRYLCIGRSFRLLGTMLESGVPLLESLNMCQSAIKNLMFRELFQTIRSEVVNGRGMSGSLQRCPYVPPAVGSMVATGERTGNLAPVLQLLGEHYEAEAETRFKDVATIVEPALVIFVGGIVATVVLSLVLPMFDFTAAADGPGR